MIFEICPETIQTTASKTVTLIAWHKNSSVGRSNFEFLSSYL